MPIGPTPLASWATVSSVLAPFSGPIQSRLLLVCPSTLLYSLLCTRLWDGCALRLKDRVALNTYVLSLLVCLYAQPNCCSHCYVQGDGTNAYWDSKTGQTSMCTTACTSSVWRSESEESPAKSAAPKSFFSGKEHSLHAPRFYNTTTYNKTTPSNSITMTITLQETATN